MKSKILSILLLFSTTFAMAQVQGIGIHFGGYDFYGPQTGNTYFFTTRDKINYGDAKNDTSKKTVLLWQPLVRGTYWFKLNNHFDINLGLSLADIEYPTSKKDSIFIDKELNNWYNTPRNDRFLAELDARINYNILVRSEHNLSPYIFAGITSSYHNVFFGTDLPVGIGLNIRMDKGIYLNLESSYKIALSNNDYNHLQHTAGVIFWFKPHYRVPQQETPAEQLAAVLPPPDADHDGVVDSLDQCPTIAGLPEFNGCPDTDGDGVPDNEDDCPLVAGLKAFNGCPDTDGDGIPDNKDKCPYVAGPADRGGCPVPDQDHDGIPDDQDACPTVPGTAANHGCPDIKPEVIELVQKQAHSIFFESGRATIKQASYKSLDRIARVMQDDPALYVTISGYTDNVGSTDKNLKLSDDRANACRSYLINKGIAADRITAKGYGEANPVASNKTALGRSQNRRTEFKLRNYK